MCDDPDIPPDVRDAHEHRAAHWQRQIRDLDREIATLRHRRGLRVLANLDDTDELPLRTLARLLGPIPNDPKLRGRYGDLLHSIADYRDRWDITDTTTALGPNGDSTFQQQERRRLADRLRDLTTDISHDRDHGISPREFTHSPELGR